MNEMIDEATYYETLLHIGEEWAAAEDFDLLCFVSAWYFLVSRLRGVAYCMAWLAFTEIRRTVERSF